MWLFGVLEGKNSEVLEKRGNEIYDCYNKRSTRSIWRIHDTGNDLRSGKKNELHFVNVTTEKKKKRKILIPDKLFPFSMTLRRDHSHYSSTVSVYDVPL